MKFGEIYTYKNAEEAKAFVGKKGAFSDYLRAITESPTECIEGTFRKVEEEGGWPFFRDRARSGYQFFRPILEDEEELMTHRQLAEWLAKGYGEYSARNSVSVFSVFSYFSKDADKPVRYDILIRRWKDTEWSKPIKAIYEEDCK